MLAIGFLKLILVAIVIALPIAWLGLKQWQQAYAYHVGLDWWVFVLTALLVLLIAFVTVSFQSIRASLSNPTQALKNE